MAYASGWRPGMSSDTAESVGMQSKYERIAYDDFDPWDLGKLTKRDVVRACKLALKKD